MSRRTLSVFNKRINHDSNKDLSDPLAAAVARYDVELLERRMLLSGGDILIPGTSGTITGQIAKGPLEQQPPDLTPEQLEERQEHEEEQEEFPEVEQLPIR